LIFAGTLPRLFMNFYELFHQLLSHQASYPYPILFSAYQNFVTPAIGSLLKAALGLYLFFASHGFANFWRLLRNFGTPHPPQSP
jgi:hypothetical protein